MAFATWNPSDKSAGMSLSGGNLTTTGSDAGCVRATQGKSFGKWYWEITVGTPAERDVGIANATHSLATFVGGSANSWGYYGGDGSKYTNGSGAAYGSTFTTAAVISVALDMDSGKVWFAKNGTWQNSGDPAAGTGAAFTGLTGTIFPAIGGGDNGTDTANFGASAFVYSVPSGFASGVHNNASGTGSVAIALSVSGGINLSQFTSTHRAIVQGARTDHYCKFEVTDPDLSWVDVSSDLDTPDWLNAVNVSDMVDQNTMSMNTSLARDVGSLSLAPLMEASTLNRDSLSNYAPLLDLRRMWRCSIAVVASGNSPSGSYKEVGKGYIDTISVNDRSNSIDLVGRGEEAPLIDHFVSPAVDYAVGVQTAMETVLQDMLDDELGVLAPTIYVPAPMNYTVQDVTLEEGSLMSSLAKIAGMAGAVLRYRYDEANINRLTLYKPEREAEAGQEDWSIASTEYLNIPLNKIDLSGVRNNIIVRYVDTAGATQEVTAVGVISQARYGERTMLIDLSAESQVNDSTGAQLLADAVLSDLQFPALEQRIETLGFWFVRLQDYARTDANGVHYDTNQYGGVTGFSHQIQNGSIRTSIDMGGAPRGGYRRWFPWGQKIEGMKPRDPLDFPSPPRGLIVQIDASQETAYVDNDDVATATDWSGHNFPATNPQTVAFQPKYRTGQTPSGRAAFEFLATNNGNWSGLLNTNAGAGEPEYLKTGLVLTPTNGMTVFIVARKNGASVEHTVFYRIITAVADTGCLKEVWTGNPATSFQLKWDPTSQVVPGSDSAQWFIHCVRIESNSMAREFFNGVEDTTSWNPGTEFDVPVAFVLAGGGNIQIAEFRAYSESLSRAAIGGIFSELSAKHGV